MVEEINPKSFWDLITNYSENDMTTTEAFYEISRVYQLIDSNPKERVRDLFSMGVADGVREPISILAYIEDPTSVIESLLARVYDGTRELMAVFEPVENRVRALPTRLIYNDIADGLLADADENLKNGGWREKIGTDITRFSGKIDEFQAIPAKTTRLRVAILGVYNLRYFSAALRLYNKNAHIIGREFHVYPVYLINSGNDLAFEQGETIAFDIDSVNDDLIERIHQNVDVNKKLYAQCLYTTDKQFLSHYFNADCLKEVISSVFAGYEVDIEQEGATKRYLVVKVQCTKVDGDGITLLTTLNNVLGNIKTGDQMKSLEVLKKMID